MTEDRQPTEFEPGIQIDKPSDKELKSLKFAVSSLNLSFDHGNQTDSEHEFGNSYSAADHEYFDGLGETRGD